MNPIQIGMMAHQPDRYSREQRSRGNMHNRSHGIVWFLPQGSPFDRRIDLFYWPPILPGHLDRRPVKKSEAMWTSQNGLAQNRFKFKYAKYFVLSYIEWHLNRFLQGWKKGIESILFKMCPVRPYSNWEVPSNFDRSVIAVFRTKKARDSIVYCCWLVIYVWPHDRNIFVVQEHILTLFFRVEAYENVQHSIISWA